MRLRDGQLTCALCGARLNIPMSSKVERRTRISDDGRRITVLMLGDTEIHRCDR